MRIALSRTALTLALAAFVASTMTTHRADACGGCFAAESNTVVTDHRMIFSVSKNQTTLYDQIRYQGSPESFAWVLPIHGTVEIGLSSDALFGFLRTSGLMQAAMR